MKMFLSRMCSLAGWFTLMAVVGFCVSLLTGCGSDYCSPFDKPDQSSIPVDCQPNGCQE